METELFLTKTYNETNVHPQIALVISATTTPMQHWVRLELLPGVCVQELRMLVDPRDNSYMPAAVTVRGGANTLRTLNTVDLQPTDTWVLLLNRQDEVRQW